MSEHDKESAQYVGQPLDRVDGRLKVTGAARYAAEFDVPNIAHGALVQSTIARGRVQSIDTRDAERLPGVLAVITFRTAPRLARPSVPPSGMAVPLLSDTITFSGQNVAVVVAETLEQAQEAARRVKIMYAPARPATSLEDRLGDSFAPNTGNRPAESKRGNLAEALAGAVTKVDAVYRTPYEHHNPMEPHATVALWQGDRLTVYDATQGVSNTAQNLAEQFGIAVESVRVVDPFVGGGFGCKGQSWPHAAIAAMAARVVGRPVKIVLTRRQMWSSNGHRPFTRQAVTLGTDRDAKLVAVRHAMHGTTSIQEEFLEPTGGPSSLHYACANADVTHRLVRVNVGAPTYMRAPGESSGSFSIETAMDELAVALRMDPLELRLKNYADKDPTNGRPWSSNSVRDCYRLAAEAFGWSRRSREPRSMRDGRSLVGYGMAMASYPANYRPAGAKAIMSADGHVVIQCGTQDLGTGTYTILGQIAADALGVAPGDVQVEIADTRFPNAPTSGGSCSATSAGSAVQAAAQALRGRVIGYATSDETSPLWNLKASELTVEDGKVTSKQDPGRAMRYRDILGRYGKRSVEQEAFARPGIERGPDAGGSPQGTEPADKGKGQAYSMHGFGAQFCEVRVDPELGIVRVARWTGAFALGKVLNAKTLTSQLKGGIIWGIGMALQEESLLDARYGRFVNSNLAEYHVPVNADIPEIEIILVPEKDEFVSPLGAKGAGEIGITGAAAAISNAIYHATGRRLRDLPITLDKLLDVG